MCTVGTPILFLLMLYCGMCLITVSFVECHYENRRRATKISYFTPSSDYETLTDEYDKAHTPHNFAKKQDYRSQDSKIPAVEDYEETEIGDDSPEHITLKSWDFRQNVKNVDVEDDRSVEELRNSNDFIYREVGDDREMPPSGMAAKDYQYEETSSRHRPSIIGQRLRIPVVTARPVYHADEIDSPKGLSRLERLNQRLTRPHEDDFINTEQQRHQRQSLYKDTVPDEELPENMESLEYPEMPESFELSKQRKISEKATGKISPRDSHKGRKTRRHPRKKTTCDPEENEIKESSEAYLKVEMPEGGNQQESHNDVYARDTIVGIAASEEYEWNRLASFSSSCKLTADERHYKLVYTLFVLVNVL